ncbi:MAG: hypothetical protein R6U46_05795 [Marinilabilia sp.]
MKIFPLQPEIDRKVEEVITTIRHLKSGETSDLIKGSGVVYKKNYGVSLVHLREMAAGMEKNQELARRLWYREIRETMILATMLAVVEQMGSDEIEQWGEMIHTIELSEQMGRNLLNCPSISEGILVGWLDSHHFYRKYAAAMGFGWRLRFYPETGFDSCDIVFPLLKKGLEDKRFMRAGGFVLKMAGRFSKENRDAVLFLIHEWKQDKNIYLRQVAQDAKEEIELFL